MSENQAGQWELSSAIKDVAPEKSQLKVLHATIQKVTDDIESLSFNTAISQMMIFVNAFTNAETVPVSVMRPFLVLLNPFAPHIASELWEKLGHSDTIFNATFPSYNEAYLTESSFEYPISINGKVRAKMNFALDTTAAVSAGIDEIMHTLLEAVVLVILVVFLFLQDWRATLIPLLTVPVSLIGTFMVFPLLGFSVNVLSLLGLVLAIGLVVDDAIVVVEAVMHNIEHGMTPVEATRKAMKEVGGPVVAIAVILSAVFVPVAFTGGITGRLYQQFAITIAVSICFSAFNALTLSPALAALLLKPKKEQKGVLARFFGAFNRMFDRFTNGYTKVAGFFARKLIVSIIILVGITIAAGLLGLKVPTGFVPEEDQGYFIISTLLPDAASLERTDGVTKKIETILKNIPEIDLYTTVNGNNLLNNTVAPNAARPPREDTVTMWPRRRARMPGSTARVTSARPKTLVSNSFRISSASPSSTAAR